MSSDKKEAATADALENLKDHRENRRSARHSIALSALQDTRITLDAVEKDVRFKVVSPVLFIDLNKSAARFARPYWHRVYFDCGSSRQRAISATSYLHLKQSCIRLLPVRSATLSIGHRDANGGVLFVRYRRSVVDFYLDQI
jgi:hypothetical protein